MKLRVRDHVEFFFLTGTEEDIKGEIRFEEEDTSDAIRKR
jgi:hypothetical protein